MVRAGGLVVLMGVAGFVGFVHSSSGSAVPEEGVQFTVTADPLADLSDSILRYGIGNNGAGGTVPIGNFPANSKNSISAVAQIPDGVLNLLPTYTYFSLYTVTSGNQLISQGIAVAINESDYADAASKTFDEEFGTNIDAAFNDGQTHTEADLIQEFDNTGMADADFTAGISNTPAAEIPYGGEGPLVLYSDGTNGGTIEVTAAPVPEPAGAKVIGALGVFLVWRNRRRIISSAK